MLKLFGAVLLTLGSVFLFTCSITNKYEVFLIQILLGPAFVFGGWNLMK